MTEKAPETSLTDRIKDLSAYGGFGTLLLYLFVYQAIRFHITALGIVTDLGVLDERYLFAGARFFVFLGFCLPLLALIGLPAALLTKFIFDRRPHRWKVMFRPTALLWFSLIFALAMIQTWMNACLSLSDLPLAARLPEPRWLAEILRKHDTIDVTIFFLALLLCGGAVSWPVIAVSRLPLHSRGLKALFGTSALMAALTVLLIPVNFGMVVMPYNMERTAAIGKVPLAAGQQAWLLWEGKEWMTYFVKSAGGVSIVVVPVKEIDRIEVKGSDSLFDVLYGSPGGRK